MPWTSRCHNVMICMNYKCILTQTFVMAPSALSQLIIKIHFFTSLRSLFLSLPPSLSLLVCKHRHASSLSVLPQRQTVNVCKNDNLLNLELSLFLGTFFCPFSNVFLCLSVTFCLPERHSMLRKGTVLKGNHVKTAGFIWFFKWFFFLSGFELLPHSMCKYIRAGTSTAAACLSDVTHGFRAIFSFFQE